MNEKELKSKDKASMLPSLSKKQIEELAAIEVTAASIKCFICDQTEKILLLEKQRLESYSQLYAIQADYRTKVSKFVTQLGYDVDSKDIKLDVDVQTGEITAKHIEEQSS